MLGCEWAQTLLSLLTARSARSALDILSDELLVTASRRLADSLNQRAHAALLTEDSAHPFTVHAAIDGVRARDDDDDGDGKDEEDDSDFTYAFEQRFGLPARAEFADGELVLVCPDATQPLVCSVSSVRVR